MGTAMFAAGAIRAARFGAAAAEIGLKPLAIAPDRT